MGGQPFHYTVFYLPDDFLRNVRFRDDTAFHHGTDMYLLDYYRHNIYRILVIRFRFVHVRVTVSLEISLLDASNVFSDHFIG